MYAREPVGTSLPQAEQTHYDKKPSRRRTYADVAPAFGRRRTRTRNYDSDVNLRTHDATADSGWSSPVRASARAGRATHRRPITL